jgi:FtsH-binding integral membrane protein
MYDRDFNPQYSTVRDRATESALLLSRVSFLTIAAVICTALGAAITWAYPNPIVSIGALIGGFIMIFVCNRVAHNFPINLVALAVFAGLEGLFLGPVLMVYAKINGPLIIVQAATISVVIFAMVGTLGYTSARSYAHWLPWLLGGLFVLILGGIVLMFVQSSGGYWLYSVGGALLFVAFTFVDFTRIRHDYSAEDYIPATLAVYLDLINLFLFILRLLSRRD